MALGELFGRASPARLLSLALLAAPASGVLGAGCASEPETIRLLDVGDGGSDHSTCRTNDDCDRNAPYCASGEQRCVECLSAADCASGSSCSAMTHTCSSRCTSADDCAGIDRPVCAPSGQCVQCASDTSCEGKPDTPRCNLQSGACVQCVTQTDCGPATCFDDCKVCLGSQCVWRT
jgi:hypothetical protein